MYIGGNLLTTYKYGSGKSVLKYIKNLLTMTNIIDTLTQISYNNIHKYYSDDISEKAGGEEIERIYQGIRR